jgi:hypothetical protein
MKTLVVYYSLSGTTRTVAQALAKELRADISEIRCERYAPTFWGRIKAGRDSWTDRLPPIGPSIVASSYDLVVVGGPIWAWRPATPVRSYLRQEAARLPSVAFFLTCGGAGAERAFAEMERIAGQAPRATLVLREGEVRAGTFGAAVTSYASGLRLRDAA